MVKPSGDSMAADLTDFDISRPLIEVHRIGWNWYRYHVSVPSRSVHALGHGTRWAVNKAVSAALSRAGGEEIT